DRELEGVVAGPLAVEAVLSRRRVELTIGHRSVRRGRRARGGAGEVRTAGLELGAVLVGVLGGEIVLGDAASGEREQGRHSEQVLHDVVSSLGSDVQPPELVSILDHGLLTRPRGDCLAAEWEIARSHADRRSKIGVRR
ncbi:MAG: hypothetical protein ACK55I_35310, partial [bacterium]